MKRRYVFHKHQDGYSFVPGKPGWILSRWPADSCLDQPWDLEFDDAVRLRFTEQDCGTGAEEGHAHCRDAVYLLGRGVGGDLGDSTVRVFTTRRAAVVEASRELNAHDDRRL